jgi:hypothetical protein
MDTMNGPAPESFGIRVNLSLSRRDLVKVARYEVLGDDSKRDVRPVGTIETLDR